jgi:hypothetical protein
MDVHVFVRYVSPLTEEAVKALFIAFVLWQRRVGFLVDAAVLGFAVGTGFAIVENMIYLRDLGQAPLTLWVVRGLGTAILHAATTAIVAMIAKTVADSRRLSPVAAGAAGVARRGRDPLDVQPPARVADPGDAAPAHRPAAHRDDGVRAE